MPKNFHISIITVNLNNIEGLKRTMQSVFEQTWKDFEYIIIDGGSIDGSREAIESSKGRIDYWVSEPDKGIYNAMNKGIAVASGEYLLFLNSGDHFTDDGILARNHKFLGDEDLIYFDIRVVKNDAEYVRRFPDKLVFSYFTKYTLPHQATFIKVDLFKRTGYYDEGLKIVSDWKFFLESICDCKASYLKVNEILSIHYLDGVSTDPENWDLVLEERRKVLESKYSFFLEDSQQIFKYREQISILESKISILRKSRKIGLLIKLGLLNKF
ncbi:glycosyltransferase family 2 protein [Zunongwangia sp. H14]|uniref:glycosyltransferase family 2 protein n=1 Tax=Zunongwangia sp. H14 TaxID=3240792 RepID=UPI003569675B